MSDLRISPTLALPPDVVTQVMAILARRGAGKTHTASVLVEEVVKAQLPVVVLDPTGAWWGLRSSADGKKAGMPVVILGGEHGDVPLEQTAGAVIADVVIEHPGAYVLDMSDLVSGAAQDRFVTDFLERLYRAKARRRDALLVVVDEADSFAPQRPQPGQQRMLGAMESIARRGRLRGIGVLLISQRAAVLNKNVLTQIEVLIAMQTTGPQDRAAIDEWVKGNGTDEQRATVIGSLASLERGEAWVWSPSWLRILERIRIRRRETFDSSKTPEAGAQAITPQAFAKVDLAALGQQIAATVEKAKAEDPKALQRRIRELEAESAARLGVIERRAEPQVVEKLVEVPVLNGQVDQLRAVVAELVHVGEQLVGVGTSITAAIGRVTATPMKGRVADGPRGVSEPRPMTPVSRGQRPPVEVAATRQLVAARPASEGGEPGEVKLKAGAHRMLQALARLHPTPLTRQQTGTLAQVQPGGTFSSYLSNLRMAGLVDLTADGRLVLTSAGAESVASSLGSGAPSTDELVAIWSAKVKAGARRMLQELVAAYPEGMTRGELAQRAEVQPGGTFSSYLSNLRSNGLIDESQGDVRASGSLFMGDR